jgi:hypothetical protein
MTTIRGTTKNPLANPDSAATGNGPTPSPNITVYSALGKTLTAPIAAQ